MSSINGGSVFLASVIVGGQDFRVVIDTGSSDPWLAVTDFVCVEPTTNEIIEEFYCRFGPLYDSTASSTYEEYPDRSMNLSYADGETLNGLMGRESFTMGGITVPEQEFGMVNYAAWYGDDYSSGLIGFAYRVSFSPQHSNSNLSRLTSLNRLSPPCTLAKTPRPLWLGKR
jgi:hypothetical protein